MFGFVSKDEHEELREWCEHLRQHIIALQQRIALLEGTAPSDSRVTHTAPVAAREGNVFYPQRWR